MLLQKSNMDASALCWRLHLQLLLYIYHTRSSPDKALQSIFVLAGPLSLL